MRKLTIVALCTAALAASFLLGLAVERTHTSITAQAEAALSDPVTLVSVRCERTELADHVIRVERWLRNAGYMEGVNTTGMTTGQRRTAINDAFNSGFMARVLGREIQQEQAQPALPTVTLGQ